MEVRTQCGGHSLESDFIRDHIWGDLRPYFCTLENCDEEGQLFSSINAWKKHDLRKHNGQTFDRLHKRSCPFCSKTKASLEHLTRHLKELALFALPRSINDLDYEVDSNDAGSSSSRDSFDIGSSDDLDFPHLLASLPGPR